MGAAERARAVGSVSAVISITKEGDLYRADIDGLPYCTEWAETEQEAWELAQDSIETTREMLGEIP